jgi:hypothetical protein
MIEPINPDYAKVLPVRGIDMHSTYFVADTTTTLIRKMLRASTANEFLSTTLRQDSHSANGLK